MEKKLDKDCNAFVSHTLAGKMDSVKVYGEPKPQTRELLIAGLHTRVQRGDVIHYVAGNVYHDYRVLTREKVRKGSLWVTKVYVEPMLNELSEMMEGVEINDNLS